MKETRWSCDRCGEAIVADRTTIEVVTGPERLRRPTSDFCAACAREFWEWVDRPRAPAPDPSDEPGRSKGEARRRLGARARPAS